MPTLGAALRKARKSKHLTLVDVKGKTELSVSFLSDVERDVTNPSIDTLEKLAKCYGVTVSELLSTVNFDTDAPSRQFPPGFEEFEKWLRNTGDELSQDMRELLLQVEYRSSGDKESTVDDWRRRYYFLRNEIQ